jgi:hypothetical protein
MNYKQGIKDKFSFSGEARKWKEMYDDVSTLFEYHMQLMINKVLAYITHQYDQSSRTLDFGCSAGIPIDRLLSLGYNARGINL